MYIQTFVIRSSIFLKHSLLHFNPKLKAEDTVLLVLLTEKFQCRQENYPFEHVLTRAVSIFNCNYLLQYKIWQKSTGLF